MVFRTIFWPESVLAGAALDVSLAGAAGAGADDFDAPQLTRNTIRAAETAKTIVVLDFEFVLIKYSPWSLPKMTIS